MKTIIGVLIESINSNISKSNFTSLISGDTHVLDRTIKSYDRNRRTEHLRLTNLRM